MSQLTLQQAFDLAVKQHQAGQLPQAEQLYRQILAQEPRHADALHMLGLIAHQVGRHDVAVDLIRQAIVLQPQFSGSLQQSRRRLEGSGATRCSHRSLSAGHRTQIQLCRSL